MKVCKSWSMTYIALPSLWTVGNTVFSTKREDMRNREMIHIHCFSWIGTLSLWIRFLKMAALLPVLWSLSFLVRLPFKNSLAGQFHGLLPWTCIENYRGGENSPPLWSLQVLLMTPLASKNLRGHLGKSVTLWSSACKELGEGACV